MDDYPETDEYGRRFGWYSNYSTMRYERVYAPVEDDEEADE